MPVTSSDMVQFALNYKMMASPLYRMSLRNAMYLEYRCLLTPEVEVLEQGRP